MRRRTLFVIVFTLLAGIALGFRLLLDLGLGTLTFKYPPATALTSTMTIATAAHSISYLNKVGGVAFGGTATSTDGSKVVRVSYDAKAADGERLAVTLAYKNGGTKTVTAPIHDWELAPIANFAATSQTACFTLFGNLQDENRAERERSAGNHILNYNQAFMNTLLGLRLFQADILLLSDEASDLPVRNDHHILGMGETLPNEDSNSTNLHEVLEAAQDTGEKFQSYLICDFHQSITFKAAGDVLKLDGDPYWYCWKTEGNSYFVTEETPVIHLRKLSSTISASIAGNNGINPAVYHALQDTMRFSAFLRYVKKSQPDAFRSLVRQLRGASVEPKVRTPTVLVGMG